MEKRLKIGGMHCKSCELLLSDVIGEMDGVTSASFDNEKGLARVYVRDESALIAVRKAIEKEGYKVLG